MKGALLNLKSSSRTRWMYAVALAVLLVTFWFAPITRAADGAEEHSAESGYTTLFRWLNFALVFGGAGYFIAKKAPPFFRKRAEAISSSLTEAAAVKAEAERQLQQAEYKLKNLDKELAALRAAAKGEAAAEAERLQVATQSDRAKIVRAADAEIEAAGRAAQSELRAIAAQMAVERATDLIQQQMTQAARAGIFRSFVGRLAGSAN
jgi:F-type H+-transporting ATPase subunit b